MVLVDTSVWIDVFRDATGAQRAALRQALSGDEVVLSRFNQLELLQGCRDEREWGLLSSYLAAQEYLEMAAESWEQAARIYVDLRRRGRSVRSPIDCCIAQLAMEHDALLLHRDRDFAAIATIRPLRQAQLR
ncbi:MAG: type II toxin-antitoxin system VapC family toxin [Thermoanaerobaculia bacterium]